MKRSPLRKCKCLLHGNRLRGGEVHGSSQETLAQIRVPAAASAGLARLARAASQNTRRLHPRRPWRLVTISSPGMRKCFQLNSREGGDGCQCQRLDHLQKAAEHLAAASCENEAACVHAWANEMTHDLVALMRRTYGDAQGSPPASSKWSVRRSAMKGHEPTGKVRVGRDDVSPSTATATGGSDHVSPQGVRCRGPDSRLEEYV